MRFGKIYLRVEFEPLLFSIILIPEISTVLHLCHKVVNGKYVPKLP